mmetsp:Transcript_7846/g.11846  ORF Transcript_7846/g.11846 Transcript_7846/m.11846 type:complete len:245 (+) Transcript_7846:55-789(+)|eukprot:CAMPEP_0171456760 /NCGR_PEP_ID=MMETSP0945-20130129/3111_1 /TAXON_ID=109269 /ORGANISM="Vaucheria litorea, Strain CCMP2940" /LENGTH=244 /DNA_ID=CAMNT_0011982235 /DNA_START=53 /DNA_END=787 /DNA_ORIENTATION=-
MSNVEFEDLGFIDGEDLSYSASDDENFINNDLNRDNFTNDAINADIKLLSKAWVEEQCAPELLVYKESIVERMKDHVKGMQEALNAHRVTGIDEMFVSSLYQMDLDRIRFSVVKYIRLRLQKIEKHVFYILENAKEIMKAKRMNQSELKYAKDYCNILHGHLKAKVLDHLPEKYANIKSQSDQEKIFSEPDLDVFVVCRVLRDIGSVEISNEQDAQIELRKGDEYMLRYRPIRKFIFDESIELI